MILDYNPSKDYFVLRVPRGEEDVSVLVNDHGLDFSETASSPGEAVFIVRDRYAAAHFYDYATLEAEPHLSGLNAAIQASWAEDTAFQPARPDWAETPWDFQRAGVEYAMRVNNVLIGDQPGLGKTAQAIMVANEMRAKRVLVVCPANIRLQWAKAIRNWSTMDGRYLIYPILKSSDGVNPVASWTIVSYDLCRNQHLLEALKRNSYDLVVLDEAHYLKTGSAKRTHAVLGGLTGSCGKLVALTGTPLPNRPRECLEASALVLTNRGWTPIIGVQETDLLWDGEEWVKHEGLLYQGCAQTVCVGGISATEQHLFLAKFSWVPAGEVEKNGDIANQILASGSANLPWSAWRGGLTEPHNMFTVDVTVEELRERLSSACALGDPLDVVPAGRERAPNFSNTRLFVPMTRSERASLELCKARLAGATRLPQKHISIMVDAVFSCAPPGAKIEALFWFIYFHFLMLKTRNVNSIASTMAEGMNPGTFVGQHEVRTCPTGEKFGNLKPASKNLKPVFDLANAGPRQRFTVLSQHGPMIVHNCFTLAQCLDWSSIDWQSERQFQERYNPPRMRGRPDLVGRLPELQARLRANFMVRRMFRDVMTQMPALMHEIVHLAPDAAIRKALEAEHMLNIDPDDLKGADAKILGEVSVVRRLMGVAMAPGAADYCDMLLDEGVEKLFVVAHHHQVLDILEQKLHKWGVLRVDGRTSPTQRQLKVDQFQSDPSARIFLGGLTAVGTGTDGLQRVCNRVVLVETSWVPGENEQIVGRLFRGGQTMPVLASLLAVEGSFAERIIATALRKMQNIHSALDKEHV